METVGAARVTSPNKVDARTRLADFYSKQTRRNKTDEPEKRKQLQDYVTWVNTYLKRRPGVRLICDLRSLSDGITLVQLAEIVARDTIPGIVALPVSLADRTANIEKACDFLKQKGVNLPSDLVKDIVDGSLKAAMRVVVAIADQFLPTSVRRVQPMSRPRAYTESSPNTGSQRGSSTSPNCTLNRSTGEPPQKSPSPVTQLMTTTLGRNNHLPLNMHRRSFTPEMRPESPIYSTPIDCIEGSSGEIAEHTRRPSLGRKKGRDGFNTEKQMLVLEELAQSQTEVMDMKNQMLQLFALLQRNPNSSPTAISSTPELQNASSRDSQQSDSDASDGLITTVAGDQKITSRSIDQLKEQLAQNSKVEEVKQSKGEEDEDGWLRKELEECREQLKKLKSELLRKEYKHDTEMVDAKNIISEKEIMIMTLRHELSQHREGISKELGQLSQQLDHSHNIQGSFVAQLKEKEAEIAILRDQLQRVSSHDPPKMQMTNGTSEKHKKTVPEEMDMVRTCLGSLRKSLSAQDPQQHTIDQLEHAVASLVDLAVLSTSPRDPSPTLSRKHYSRSSKHRAHGVDESGELKYVGGRQKKHGTGSGGEVSPGMASHSSPLSPDEVTRVVYYLDKDETPYRTSIPKRCYEVTLRDFRNAISKSSSHKFFFKSQDPDIGQVKEEVSDSSAIVPNYEGKIVGWVSEKRK